MTAILETDSFVFFNLSPASNMRQRVRYSIGEDPTVSLNRKAKVVLDMPARSASVFSVQR